MMFLKGFCQNFALKCYNTPSCSKETQKDILDFLLRLNEWTSMDCLYLCCETEFTEKCVSDEFH
jgi:hypothetical protein